MTPFSAHWRARRVSAFCFTAMVVFGSSAAFAQSGREDGEVSELVVTSSKLSGYAADGGVAKVAVPLREIPQTITVITRERMEDQNLFSLDDVMVQAPGITNSNQAGQSSEDNRYISRGFPIDTFLVDGVPGLTFTSPQPDIFLFESVEILRGPSGLFSGAGSPGGAVNMIRKRPGERRALSVAATAGSWSNYRAEIDASTPVTADGKLKVRGGAAYQEHDYFYIIGHRTRAVGYGVVSYDFAPKTKLTVGVTIQETKPTPSTGLPAYAGGGLLKISRETFVGVEWADRLQDENSAYAELVQGLGENWTLRVNVQRAVEDRREEYAFLGSAPVTLTNGRMQMSYINRSTDRTVDSYDANVSGPLKLFGRTHQILIGADRQEETRLYNQSFITGFFFQDIYNPNFNPPKPVFPILGGTKTKVEQYGAYGQARLEPLDGLKVIVGGRLSWWENNSTPITRTAVGQPWVDGRTTGYSVKKQVTPYFGAVYDIDHRWSAYGSYSRIFAPQSAQTFTGETLEPVLGNQAEVGLKGELLEKRLLAAFALYNIDQVNRAQSDPDHVGFSIASGRVRSRGAEAELTGRVTPALSVSAGYAYNTNKYIEDAANRGQPFTLVVPKHSLKLWANQRLGRFDVGGGINAFGQQVAGTGTSRVRQPAYAVVSLRAGYRFNEKIRAAINVNNVFDEVYYGRITGIGRGNFYGDPRNVSVSLRANF